MKAMLLTAGLGTRLRPVTEKLAKPAVPFLNVPLLYYPLALMEEAGLTSLVLNTHHHPEQIAQLAQAIPGATYETNLSPEPGAPLGSGGGIWKARRYLEGGDFLVSNGDEVILPRTPGVMKRLLGSHKQSGAITTILVMRHPLVGTQFGGVWADADGRVHGFGKDPSKFGPNLTGYHYIGVMVMSDRVFNYLPEGESNILYDALAAAIAKGDEVRIEVGDFTWYETGNPHDFVEATRDALRLVPSVSEDAMMLQKILKRFGQSGTQLEGHTMVGPGARIESGSRVDGFVVLGADAVIEQGATVENCVLLPGARVRRGQDIRGQIVLA